MCGTLMCIPDRVVLLFTLIAAIATAAPNQFVARYLPIGSSGSSTSLAVDASGNLFVVATVEEPSGQQQIRAIKTDGQGNQLASFDFGSATDAPAGAAVDPQGNLVIVGTTNARGFPVVSLPGLTTNPQAGFIVKLDSQLTKILFSTVLGAGQSSGGAIESNANAVALDTAGDIYVAGSTTSANFPITPGAFQTSGPMGNGAGPATFGFITEISPDGNNVIYSTFFGSDNATCIGGSGCIGIVGSTSAKAIAVDSAGNIVIGGSTTASQLPITAGTLGQMCECSYLTEPLQYVESGFLAKFAPGGKQLDWATYIPLAQTGPASEYGVSIATLAIDAQGNVIFGGGASSGLVVTNGALQSAFPGGNPTSSNPTDGGFVAKVDSSAKGYLFSTYFGGLAFGFPSGVTELLLDPQGDIWLTGGSDPSTLPLPGSIPLLGNTFVAELSADGATVIDAITAPAGAAGEGIVFTPNGSPTALGSAGSLLLDLPGQPASLVGVANSAGIQVSSDVAPYELVSFYGAGLGPADALGAQLVNGSVTNSLGGVQVLFNDVAAPLLYVGPSQINAIVPSSVYGLNTATVQIVTPNGTLTGPTLSVVPSEPEVFQNGPPMPAGGAAVALNQDGSLNSAANPATGGSIVTVWATGAGISLSLGGDGAIASELDSPLLPVSVLNSSQANESGVYSLAVLYAGSAPGLVAGALQVNFQLPTNLFDVYQLTCQLQVGTAVSGRFSVYVQP
jgi:uncharacterized protein (TIGR03437 family)